MTRVSFSHHQCSVAQCLSSVGDIWSFLIIRDAMAGISRYSDFEKSLGIAKNILKNRLNQLVENELMNKVEVGQTGSRFEYHLTQKGQDLFPVLVAIYQWSEKWVDEDKRSPFSLCDSEGVPIGKMLVADASGKELKQEDILRLQSKG
ncbi:winged helix-turn-helix transcriptional regulator [Agarilytica rhodophyticola]|uniref:winged helix-turn-helix transcriptional regulator n=1 Tax=Agarilytica rhodophyticola TaxID=1737490 RepID=UPI000B341D2F|nr:helix-turn-helix domain-containing protein [Agarilytica rhodophyticola]